MDNRYYYFYDLNEVLIDRYPSKIANEIKKIEFNSRFVFIYSEKYYHGGEPKNLPEGSLVFYIPSLDEKKIKLILKISCSKFNYNRTKNSGYVDFILI